MLAQLAESYLSLWYGAVMIQVEYPPIQMVKILSIDRKTTISTGWRKPGIKKARQSNRCQKPETLNLGRFRTLGHRGTQRLGRYRPLGLFKLGSMLGSIERVSGLSIAARIDNFKARR